MVNRTRHDSSDVRAPGRTTGRLAPTGGAGTNVLIDAAAAGELLGVPKSWVLAQARADRIPHLRLGRYVRFSPAQLEAWWQERMRGPVVAGPGPVSRAAKTP
jgi:excisionase family DNA binding protein